MFAIMPIMPLCSLLDFQFLPSNVSANTTSKNVRFGTYHAVVGLKRRRSTAYNIPGVDYGLRYDTVSHIGQSRSPVRHVYLWGQTDHCYI